MNFCEVCRTVAKNKCSACQNVFYCTKEHQRMDWRRHKVACKPFKLMEDDILGRHLVATRPLKPNTVILKELPLIWGPSQVSIPICVSCSQRIQPGLTDNHHLKRECSKCGWPICSDICEKSPEHIPECQYTAQRGTKVSVKDFSKAQVLYEAVMVLRCLYHKQFLPKTWKYLDRLQSNIGNPSLTVKQRNKQKILAQFIQQKFRLAKIFTDTEIMKVCGLIELNSHEVPLTDPSYLAIYKEASFFEHNCQANCAKSFTDKGEILITSVREIELGEHLSISYTDSLWGTLNRQLFLNETKYFWCQCARCQDPTEFGTYFSTVKCQQRNCTGYLLTSPTKSGNELVTSWNCQQCGKAESAYFIHDLLERIGNDLNDLDKTSIEKCLDFLKLYESYLPPAHFYNTELKLVLIQNLGSKSENGLTQLTDQDLNFKLTLCKDLKQLLEVLVPAERRTLGEVLFELHSTQVEMSRRKMLVENQQEDAYQLIKEAKEVLVKVLDLLQFEPSSLPEGQLYLQAKQNLVGVNNILGNTDNGTLTSQTL